MKKKQLKSAAISAALLSFFCSCQAISSEIPESSRIESTDNTDIAVPAEASIADIPQEDTYTDINTNTDTSAIYEGVQSFSEPVSDTKDAESGYEAENEGGNNEITEIKLTFYNVTLNKGEKRMPIVTMLPDSAADKSEIWTSSDESIASVDSIGNITAQSEGICTVTVQSAVCPDVSASVEVTVKAPVTEVTYIDGILIANKTYALPPDYNPGVDPSAQAAFDKMQAAAYDEGLNIYISSGFRSYDYQAGLYERYVQRSGKEEADRYSARPGHSEHQTGLAFDLNTIDMTFADTDEYQWVKKHCAEYGFIIRYPEDGEEVTGYMYEPWHLRYLGKETAEKVYDSGLTLEEYLGITSKYDE